jgi:hypothetical protein
MVSAASASGAAPQLAGRRAVVAAGGMPIGKKVSQGLARHGALRMRLRLLTLSSITASAG